MKHLHQTADGFFLLFRGVRVMFGVPGAWWLLTIPLLLNLGIFVCTLIGVWKWIMLVVPGLIGSGYESVWLVVLTWMVYLIFLFLALLVYAFLFSMIAEVIGAPFYEELGVRLDRQENRAFVERPWYREVWFALTQESRKALLLGAVVVIGFFLQFFPVVGQILSGVLGFVVLLVTAGGDAVGPALARRGLMLGERRKWVLTHLGPVLGLGAAKAVGLLIPFVNIFVPPVAAVAGTLLVQEQESLSNK